VVVVGFVVVDEMGVEEDGEGLDLGMGLYRKGVGKFT
jgi:hypothetical protein